MSFVGESQQIVTQSYPLIRQVSPTILHYVHPAEDLGAESTAERLLEAEASH